jgi:uncharacterized membrane-anchored protein YitT (DUF2179 family)
MKALLVDKRFSFAWFRNYALILVGSATMALGYVLFMVPHKIVPGGVYGLSIIAHYLFHLPTGTTAFVLNVPLLIWGVKELGPRFGAKTVLGLALTSVQVDLYTWLWGTKPLTDDIIMAAVFGGVFVGAGLGLIFKAKATSGGSDIVANIIKKRTGAPVGRNIMMVDVFVVTAGVAAFRKPEMALYALIALFVIGRTVDTVLEGFSEHKAAFIISEKKDEIRDAILNAIGRSGTEFAGKGLFQGDDRPVVLTAVSRRELAILEEHVRRIDPAAFVIVFDAKEILGHGQGFKPLKEAGA